MSHPSISALLAELHQAEQTYLQREAPLLTALERALEDGTLARVQRMTLRASLEQLLSVRATFHEQLKSLELSSPTPHPLSSELLSLDRTPLADLYERELPEPPVYEPPREELFALDETPVHEVALTPLNTAVDLTPSLPRVPEQKLSSQRLFNDSSELPTSVSPQPHLPAPFSSTPLPERPTPLAPNSSPQAQEAHQEGDDPLNLNNNALMQELMQELEEMGLGELEALPPSLDPTHEVEQGMSDEMSALEPLTSQGSEELGLHRLSSASAHAELERAPRVALGVRVQVTSEVLRFDALAHNINTGGIFLETDTPLEAGEEVDLSFELDRSAFVVKARAQVRWLRPRRNATISEPMGAGLKFTKLSESARAELAAYTAERLDEGI